MMRREAGARLPLSGRRMALTLLTLGLVLALCLMLGALVGSSSLSLRDALGALTGSGDDLSRAVIWQVRAPRVLFGAVVGAGLAVAGAVFQALLRNPLADPYVLGVSGGAALGGTAYLTLGLGVLPVALGLPGASMVGAIGAMALLLMIDRWTPADDAGGYVLLLSGVIFNALASALITLCKAVVSAQKAQELLFFLMGTLSVEGVDRGALWGCAAVVLGCIVALWAMGRDLDVMSLGAREARALGVDASRVRKLGVGLASVMVAVCVAYTGMIGFVGLIVPHALRLRLGPDHRLLLPACALGGAALLVACDALARASFALFATTLPVGVVTALLGAPAFLLLLRGALRRQAVA